MELDSHMKGGAAAAEAIRLHWQSIFNYKEFPIEFMRHMDKFIQQVPSDHRWIIHESDFLAMVQKSFDSAPGPDRIPCSAYNAANQKGTKILYRLLLGTTSQQQPL